VYKGIVRKRRERNITLQWVEIILHRQRRAMARLTGEGEEARDFSGK
jgi:hypothetical protein